MGGRGRDGGKEKASTGKEERCHVVSESARCEPVEVGLEGEGWDGWGFGVGGCP